MRPLLRHDLDESALVLKRSTGSRWRGCRGDCGNQLGQIRAMHLPSHDPQASALFRVLLLLLQNVAPGSLIV